jgi:hypothetical protein
VSNEGSTPVAPAFDAVLFSAATSQFVSRLEIAEECFTRLHGDDRAGVLPDAIEQRGEQPTALRRILLERPDPPEVGEHFFRLVEPGIERRPRPRQLFLEGLSPEHVLALREVAHDIEVAKAVELAEELTPSR